MELIKESSKAIYNLIKILRRKSSLFLEFIYLLFYFIYFFISEKKLLALLYVCTLLLFANNPHCSFGRKRIDTANIFAGLFSDKQLFLIMIFIKCTDYFVHLLVYTSIRYNSTLSLSLSLSEHLLIVPKRTCIKSLRTSLF